MSLITKKVLNDMDYNPHTSIDTYSSDSVVIFKPHETLEKKVVFENYYHIILPLTQQLPIKVENKEFLIAKNNLFCISPLQQIKSFYLDDVDPYWAIFIDNDFLKNTRDSLDKKFSVDSINKFEVEKSFLDIINHFSFEAQNINLGSNLILECLSTELIVYLLRYINNNSGDQGDSYYQGNKKFNRVIEYMRLYYYKNLKISDLSSLLNFSKYSGINE